MLKKTLYIALFLSGSICFSQEIVNSTTVALKKNRDVFQIVNNDKKEVTLFVSDKEKVKAIQLNEKMQIIDSISTERPNTKTYTNMIGYNSRNSNARLFWASNDFENIIGQLYDFNSRKITTKEFSLVLKEEKVLQTFSENDHFFILSVIKKSNNLKLHIFDKDSNYSVKTFSLEGFHFFNRDYTKTNLYGVLEANSASEKQFSIQNINVDNPTSLTEGAKKRKCYFINDKIIITLDANINYTQIIIIDLKDFGVIEKMIKKQYIKGDPNYLNSNSFYFENKLYQIKTSSDVLYFTVKDLDDTLLKEKVVNSGDQINFKNSEIYQEGGEFGGKRTLETSTQFIRKINSLDSGLTCYNIGQNTLITFGGVSEKEPSTGQFILGQFGMMGAIVAAAIYYYNPTMESFNAYSKRKVVKIEGLFDKDGTHIDGELEPLAFDKIRTFFDKDKDVSSQTLFKMNDFYYLGYYDNKTNQYIITKFAD